MTERGECHPSLDGGFRKIPALTAFGRNDRKEKLSSLDERQRDPKIQQYDIQYSKELKSAGYPIRSGMTKNLDSRPKGQE